MKRHTLRWYALVAMVLAGGTIFQSVGFTASNGLDFGCNRFTTNGVLSATNFCFLLDCENGFFGGLVDPCNDPSQGATLLDCPGGTSTGSGDSTDNNDSNL